MELREGNPWWSRCGPKGMCVNAGRKLTPYCQSKIDPSPVFWLVTWLFWSSPAAASMCDVLESGRSLRLGR